MKKEKIKEWVKENKVTIALGIGTVTAGVIAILAEKRIRSLSTILDNAVEVGIDVGRMGNDVSIRMTPVDKNNVPVGDPIMATWATEGAIEIAEALTAKVADITQNVVKIESTPVKG